MHHTKIKVFKVAQTRINQEEITDWLTFLGVKDVPKIFQQLSTATDASALIALGGKRCYNAFETNAGLNPNVSKIRTDHKEYVENILRSGHGSVIEHATWTFAIENISRVFTGELNRHRAGVAISEGSMRFIRFDDVGYTIPSLIDPDNNPPDVFFSEYTEEEFKANAETTLALFDHAFQTMETWNLDLTNIWKIDLIKNFELKKRLTSMFRRVIGMGISTGGIWTLNARALRHVLTMRGNMGAEEEIYYVANLIANRMISEEPLLFGDFEKDEKGSLVPKYNKV